MEEDLEVKVNKGKTGKAIKRVIGTAMILGTGFAAGVLYGGAREAENHAIAKKLYQKEKVNIIMNGYAPTPGTDHEAYKATVEMVIDTTNKTFHYNVKKDSIDYGPVTTDGNIGYSLPERTKQGLNDAKQDMQEKVSSGWEQTKKTLKGGWEELKQYLNKDTIDAR